jgi:hypothetical protein
MNLYEFTTVTDPSGKQVVLVAGRVADHPDPKQQTEWITFQFAVDVPTALNGARQRTAALERARDVLHSLSLDFDKIGSQRDPSTLGPTR